MRASLQVQGVELVTASPATRRGERASLDQVEGLVFVVCYDGFWGRFRFLQFLGQGQVVLAVSLDEPVLFELVRELATDTEAREMLEADGWVASGGREEEVQLDLAPFLCRLRDHTNGLTKGGG